MNCPFYNFLGNTKLVSLKKLTDERPEVNQHKWSPIYILERFWLCHIWEEASGWVNLQSSTEIHVLGLHLCTRIWVCTMTGMLKKPLSICQSDWREIKNAFLLIHWVQWEPKHGYQPAPKSLLTGFRLRLWLRLWQVQPTRKTLSLNAYSKFHLS